MTFVVMIDFSAPDHWIILFAKESQLLVNHDDFIVYKKVRVVKINKTIDQNNKI